MSVAKVIELVGSSPDSFDDAVRRAVQQAAETVKNITGVDVVGLTAKVEGTALTEFRANVKVAFRVERS